MNTNSIYGANKEEALKVLLAQGIDESVAISIADSMTFENNNDKEGKDMKKGNDYTLGGTVNTTSWKEFVALAKSMGINTYRKNYEVLAKEVLDKLSDSEEVLTAEDTGLPIDRVDSESIKKGDDSMKTLTKKEEFILVNIKKSSFIATKGLYANKRILTMRKLFGIIKEAMGGKQLPKEQIQGIINGLVKAQYLTFDKAENGGITFFPTVKVIEALKEVA